jgi:hypothetical protein
MQAELKKALEGMGGTFQNIVDPSAPGGFRSVMVDKNGVAKPITMAGGGEAGALANKVSATKQPANIEAIRNQTQGVLDLINNEILDKTDSLRPEIRAATGWSSYNPKGILPESEIRKGTAALNRLKAVRVVELIGELKAQSRTGATGFGQLSDKERLLLQDAASKLDTDLDEGTLNAEIVRIKGLLNKIMRPAEGQGSATTSVKPNAADLIRKYAVPGGGM